MACPMPSGLRPAYRLIGRWKPAICASRRAAGAGIVSCQGSNKRRACTWQKRRKYHRPPSSLLGEGNFELESGAVDGGEKLRAIVSSGSLFLLPDRHRNFQQAISVFYQSLKRNEKLKPARSEQFLKPVARPLKPLSLRHRRLLIDLTVANEKPVQSPSLRGSWRHHHRAYSARQRPSSSRARRCCALK